MYNATPQRHDETADAPNNRARAGLAGLQSPLVPYPPFLLASSSMPDAPPPPPSPVESNNSSSSPSGPSEKATRDERRFPYSAELKRKALHLVALVVPLGMHVLGRTDALWILVPSSILAVAADVLRAYSPAFNAHIRQVFGPLMRTEELPAPGEGVVINGATSVLIGATLLTVLFPLPIAVAVFVMTMTADAAAALVGRAIGQHHWPGRPHTMEGTAAFIAIGVLVMLPFELGLPGTMAGVLVAAIAEASPLPINDNIAVPLLAATVVTLLGA